MSVREFDQLPLNLFAAGEVELILRTNSEGERTARLKILLMCLYHSQFLEIREIREQYDVIMKGIERGSCFGQIICQIRSIELSIGECGL